MLQRIFLLSFLCFVLWIFSGDIKKMISPDDGFCGGGINVQTDECRSTYNSKQPFFSGSTPAKCGDQIFYMSERKVQWVSRILLYGIHTVLTPMNVFGDTFGNFSESLLHFKAHNSVKAIKICAKCQDFDSQRKRLSGFRNYCGNNYGSNETMTGILFLPSDSNKALITGNIRTVIWMKGLATTSGPSEILPRNAFGWLSAPLETAFAFLYGGMMATFSKPGIIVLNEVGALMLASRGFLVIAPDYLGYGDNKSLFKGTGIGSVYQTSSLPLWLRTEKIVRDVSGGKSKMADECYVAGASEGAAGVLPVAKALHESGVKVTAYPGAVPSFDLTESIMRRTLTVLRGEWPEKYFGWIAYGAAPFASSSPYFNIGRDESFLSENGENVILGLVNSDKTFLSMNSHLVGGLKATSECLSPKNDDLIGCPSFLNPVLVQKFRDVVDYDPYSNPEFYPCKSRNPAPELSSLCNAIGANNLNDLFASAQYHIKLCHSPSDKATRFTDVTLKYPNKSNLQLRPTVDEWIAGEKRKGSEYSHKDSCFVCNMYWVLDIIENT